MISIELTRRFEKVVQESGREAEVSATRRLVQEGFGNLHAHAGISIRKLGERIYECRTGPDWRLIFTAQKGILAFDFAGDHDEIQNC